MKRMFAGIGILLSVSAVITGLWVWFLTRPLPRTVLVGEAQDADVDVTGIGRWEVTYRGPKATFAWYRTVGAHLETHGWVAHNQGGPNIYSAPHPPELPLRFERFVGAMVWEELVIEPEFHDPRQVRLHVRRAFHLDWERWLRGLGVDRIFSQLYI